MIARLVINRGMLSRDGVNSCNCLYRGIGGRSPEEGSAAVQTANACPRTEHRFMETPGRSTECAELVMSAIVVGEHSDATDAAVFILDPDTPATQALKALAATITGNDLAAQPASTLSTKSQRSFVYSEPRNAIGWMDLALTYFNWGRFCQSSQSDHSCH